MAQQTKSSPPAYEDTERQIFALVAVQYRADPSDQHFFALCNAKPQKSEFACVSEIIYDTVASETLQPPLLAHLVKSLTLEQRYHEAAHFCRAWSELEPTNLDALRLTCLVACRRAELATAQASFGSLQAANASHAVLWALETIILLTFSDGTHAPETARYMMRCQPHDPLAPLIALDVALRKSDAWLLATAVLGDPGLLTEGSAAAKRAVPLLRQHLLALLSLRGDVKGPQQCTL